MEQTNNYAVFIPTHIRYEGQVELLLNAIKSVKNQDYSKGRIDIWISVSFENCDFKDEFDALNIADECFKCLKHNKKLYQLEHLKKLNDVSYLDYNYNLICFLDDDDMYKPDRISTIDNKLNEIKNNDEEMYIKTQVILEKALCILDEKTNKVLPCIIYWCFAVSQDACNVFFKWFCDKSLQDNNADFLFKLYLEHLHLFNEDACIDNGYYDYNTNNNNSISSINESKKGKEGKKISSYYFTCLNDKNRLVNIYGRDYKKHINRTLWKECYKHIHKFNGIEEWGDYVFGEMVKNSFYKYAKQYKK